jgi:adenylate cyclase
MALLNTVRAKLTTLVGLSALATLAALPLLHWLMTRELVDVVDDRVPEAVKGFEVELADDIHDLEAATKSLGDSDELEKALKTENVAAAEEELKVFREAYPGTAFAVYAATGKVVAQMGLPGGALPRGSFVGIDGLEKGMTVVKVIATEGCAVTKSNDPAFVMARSVRGAGTVVACMTIDEQYLANTSAKLGVELAVARGENTVSTKTAAFPTAALAQGSAPDALIDVDGKAWAIARFEPATFAGLPGRFSVDAALDMTRIRGVVRKNLALTVVVLIIAALIAIVMGSRLASLMSRALTRLNGAYKNLENDQYDHVEGVKTGDEIEALASGFNTMVDGLRERDKLRATMGKYMTQSVMDHLMAGKVELGGETLTVTILFSDIRSFTSISETMTAHELVKLLNEYFTEMVTVVMEEGGVVDKYIGDAIMAVFGAPVSKPDDARRAVRAAVRMRHALEKLNEKIVARGAPPIKTGIGLHTGEVVAGNIGSEARMEYTVIGDAVNLASRLESATKELGTDVLISEDTNALLDNELETRPVREITVKGRAKPVVVYEVIGFRRKKESKSPSAVTPAP